MKFLNFWLSSLVWLVLACGTGLADSVVVFNELHYHPGPTENQDAEWIELNNQLAVDVDLSGWSLANGISYTFPQGSILPAGAYMVVAASPAAIPGALGPWAGKLDNAGETVELRDHNNRVMDRIKYGTEGDWPVAPDGAGPTMARRARNLATDDPASWTSSREAGGTPGADNFPGISQIITTTLFGFDAAWKMDSSGNAPSAQWKNAGYDDSAWTTGTGVFQLGSALLPPPAPAGTAMPVGPATYYFRKTFSFTGSGSQTQLRLKLLADDGAGVFLNGIELARTNLSVSASHTTPASQPRRADPLMEEFLVPGSALITGTNTLAVEVHQASPLASYPQAIIDSGPVAYWRFGETGGSLADLANVSAPPESGTQPGSFSGLDPANVAQAGPRPTDLVNGGNLLGFEDINAAPSFQGSNDVAVFPDSGILNFGPGKKFSFEAWVKIPTTGSDDSAAIIAKGTGGGGEQFACDLVDGKFRFFVWNGGSPNRATEAQSTVAPTNTWQHLAGVFDQSQGIMKLYVNGVQKISVTPPSTLLSSTHEVSVGARKNVNSANYDLNLLGKVDEVALYPRALSQAEITAHFNAAFAASPSGYDSADAVFGLALDAIETVTPPTLVFNEIAAAGSGSGALIELANSGNAPLTLDGCTLSRLAAGLRLDFPLPTQSLAAGGVIAFDANALGFSLNAADRLILVSATGMILDGTVVKNTSRARFPDGSGPWYRLTATTFGAANVVPLHDEIVINEIMYHPPDVAGHGGQWIELRNVSTTTVDLTGWSLDGNVSFVFPPATTLAPGGFIVVAETPAALPGVGAIGPWSGSLKSSRDTVRLLDSAGNPADSVSYHDSGAWPEYCDGGGSSLELRDPRADHQSAENWAASDESTAATWQTFTWRGPANPGITGEPTLWNEIDIGLLDGPGEFLLDDVTVTDTTSSLQLVQNGNFSNGMNHWRAVGTHLLSQTTAEPGNPGNSVLHVVATGATEYQGNLLESTFLNNIALVSGREYEISLRARWLAGGKKLHTRLYFNRLACTNTLNASRLGGTPGQPNSRAASNIGPTFSRLTHSPVIPAAGAPVTVGVTAYDPDGINALTLKYSVAGGAWQNVAMSSANGSWFTASIPGQAAASIVQFYVVGADSLAVTATCPPRGADSRALFIVQDGMANGGSPHKFRLLMTSADANSMHNNNNVLSNGFLGATVIADETEVYYDVSARLKGSFVGRNVPRVGFNIRFQPDHLFRGVHDRIAIDRSAGASIGVKEINAKHIASAAGGIPCMRDDLGRFIHVLPSYNSGCIMRLTGFEDEYLKTQYLNGDDGQMYEFEGFRSSSVTSTGTAEGIKQPGSGGNYVNLELTDYGNDPESYRWLWLLSNHRSADDFTAAIAVAKMFALTGTALDLESKARLDVDQWLRAMAYQSLVGVSDTIYTDLNRHNIRFYARPQDGRMLYMPWDWDGCFSKATNSPLIGSGNVAKLVTVTPHNRRVYYHHLYDLIHTAFNSGYMTRWTQHYGTINGENFASIITYINNRKSFVESGLPAAIAWAATAAAPQANGSVKLTGSGYLDLVAIEINGLAYSPVWTSDTTWTVIVPLATGSNTLIIRGLDKNNQALAGNESSLVVENPYEPGWPQVKINEWLADNKTGRIDPADGKKEDWIELYNPTQNPVDLSYWSLTDNPALPRLGVLPQGTTIAAGGFLLITADGEPAQGSAALPHVPFSLAKGGETIELHAPDTRLIDSIAFGAQLPDVAEGRYPDGGTLVNTLSLPSPATPNILLSIADSWTEGGYFHLLYSTTPGMNYRVEYSSNLIDWLPLTSPSTATSTSLMVADPLSEATRFYRAVLLAP